MKRLNVLAINLVYQVNYYKLLKISILKVKYILSQKKHDKKTPFFR